MKKSSKIWLAIAGVALIVLGVLCICNPVESLFASAWMLGCLILVSGIFMLVFTIRTQLFLPNSGTRMLSALLQIAIGTFFLFNNTALTVSLPFVFAFWVLVEGITLIIESFDFKKFMFTYWWCILILGILITFFGLAGLRNPEFAGVTLTTLIGIGLILVGVAYIVALCGINKFERNVKGLKDEVLKSLQETQE